jgi:hypothetical protein
MKHSELLMAAKRHLVHPNKIAMIKYNSPYICNALDCAVHRLVENAYMDADPKSLADTKEIESMYEQLQAVAHDIKAHINKCLKLTPDGQTIPDLQDRVTLTVGMWLNKVCKIDYCDITPDSLYTYRLAWIDILIADYQAKGM